MMQDGTMQKASDGLCLTDMGQRSWEKKTIERRARAHEMSLQHWHSRSSGKMRDCQVHPITFPRLKPFASGMTDREASPAVEFPLNHAQEATLRLALFRLSGRAGRCMYRVYPCAGSRPAVRYSSQ
jgi:hypothetical protein